MNALMSLLDDTALVRKYLDRFIEDMPNLLRLMRTSYDAEQWNELSIHAHSYKSQMQYINESVAADIAFELEKKSASPFPETIQMEKLITQLEDQLENTIREIQQIIE